MPSPEEIENSSRYRLLLALEYDSVPDFVISQMKSVNAVTATFYTLSFTLLLWSLSFRFGLAGEYTLPSVLPYTLAGLILLPLLLIPLHEGVHILVFRILGGRDIRIGADLRNFIVYVTAHRHVVSALPFIVIAASPFVIISLSILISIWYVNPLWKWTLSLALLAHTTMCAGDFSMAAFFHINRNRKILTWDDAEKKVAYFFEESEHPDIDN
jgi:hypothetical protein